MKETFQIDETPTELRVAYGFGETPYWFVVHLLAVILTIGAFVMPWPLSAVSTCVAAVALIGGYRWRKRVRLSASELRVSRMLARDTVIPTSNLRLTTLKDTGYRGTNVPQAAWTLFAWNGDGTAQAIGVFLRKNTAERLECLLRDRVNQ